MSPDDNEPGLDRDPAEIDEAIATIEQALNAHEMPEKFGDGAWREMSRREAEFFEELGLEAIRRARNGRNESVSRGHVDEADRMIRANRQADGVIALQTFGGIITGSGISGLIAALAEKQPSEVILLLSIAGLAIGASVVAFTAGFGRRR